jgi:hypothetical protein
VAHDVEARNPYLTLIVQIADVFNSRSKMMRSLRAE